MICVVKTPKCEECGQPAEYTSVEDGVPFCAKCTVSQVCEERDEALADVDRLNNLHGLAPFDGKTRIRPHGIKGWWQLWDGNMCIALLTPEDIAPIVEGWKQP